MLPSACKQYSRLQCANCDVAQSQGTAVTSAMPAVLGTVLGASLLLPGASSAVQEAADSVIQRQVCSSLSIVRSVQCSIL